KLPFYANHRLLQLTFVRDHGPEEAYVLEGTGESRWLDGASQPIHEANEEQSLALTDATVQDYVRFFLHFLRSEQGAFTLIESPTEITAAEHDDEIGRASCRGRAPRRDER